VTQSAGFIFFPLTFLTASFVPLDLLDGWLAAAARLNPITYVLQAMRETLNAGWNSSVLWQGILACLILAIAMYALAVYALRVRTRRS
jgi:ABC-2 type transport system permease protein